MQTYADNVWMWPFSTSTTITSGFRPPNRPDHDGVDIGAEIEDPIYAVNSGTVILLPIFSQIKTR